MTSRIYGGPQLEVCRCEIDGENCARRRLLPRRPQIARAREPADAEIDGNQAKPADHAAGSGKHRCEIPHSKRNRGRRRAWRRMMPDPGSGFDHPDNEDAGFERPSASNAECGHNSFGQDSRIRSDVAALHSDAAFTLESQRRRYGRQGSFGG